MIFTRAWKIQNIRPYTLDMNTKRRYEFKSTHSLRKYFETYALNHMKILNVKILMGHDTGLEKSYYKPSEKEILNDYLNVVDLLTISTENKLQTTVDKDLQEKEKEITDLRQRGKEQNRVMNALWDKLKALNQEKKVEMANLRKELAQHKDEQDHLEELTKSIIEKAGKKFSR
jgi:septal ring factor EnvC (AmiA/AmiB activator)